MNPFDDAAELYDEVRPGYPLEIVERIIRFAALMQRSSIFEVGCGTGQMTRSFAARGYSILALDQGPKLAAIAARHCPTVRVVTSAFEDWIDIPGSYDLFLSAQAFHWIRPDYGLPQAAELLKRGGTIALVWTLDRSENTDFWRATDPIYRLYGPHRLGSEKPLGGFEVYRDLLSKSEQFAGVEEVRHAWTQSYVGDRYLKLLSTASDHRTLPEPQRTKLFDEIGTVIQRFGGSITREYETVALLARKQ